MIAGGIDMTRRSRLSSAPSAQPVRHFARDRLLRGITAPATGRFTSNLNNGAFNEITVLFQPAPVTPVKLTPRLPSLVDQTELPSLSPPPSTWTSPIKPTLATVDQPNNRTSGG